MTNDVVCKMQVSEQQAAASGLVSRYEDRTYYFCSGQCKREFDNNPRRYALEQPMNSEDVQNESPHPYAG